MLTDRVIDDELLRVGLAHVDDEGHFVVKKSEPFRFAEFVAPVEGLNPRMTEKSERMGKYPRLLIETSRTKGTFVTTVTVAFSIIDKLF